MQALEDVPKVKVGSGAMFHLFVLVLNLKNLGLGCSSDLDMLAGQRLWQKGQMNNLML